MLWTIFAILLVMGCSAWSARTPWLHPILLVFARAVFVSIVRAQGRLSQAPAGEDRLATTRGEFLLDIESLRRRARERIEEGVFTRGY
jgi:hypothetical protein